MTHLTADELIDAMEADAGSNEAAAALPAGRRAHLAGCAECRQRLDHLAAALIEAKQVSVPEPSPLFWTHFSQRVNAGIDAAGMSAWPQWLRWQVLLPLGAVAMVILALMSAVPKQEHDEIVAAEVSAPAPSEDTWASFAELVGTLDVELAAEAGVIAPGVADRAVQHLTAEEQRELTRLLKAELAGAKS
jgi:hypothetical protein